MNNIWAVARQMIAEGLRRGVTFGFVCILALLMAGAFTIRGDNTLTGGVQTFLTYSLSAVTVVLSLVSLFLSKSVSDELVGRQIFLLMTKPIARWEYLTGKWLGITLLNVILLAVAGLCIYSTVYLLAKRESKIDGDRERLLSEVLVARHAIAFEVPDFSADAARTFEQRKAEGAYAFVEDLNESAAREEIRREFDLRWRAVPPGEGRRFEFKGLMGRNTPDRMIQLRYYSGGYGIPLDEILRTMWAVGDPDKGTKVYRVDRRDVANRYHVLEVPADAVADDGTLTVHFRNYNPFPNEPQFDYVFSFEADSGIEVLFVVGSFGGNLSRLLALILCRLMFLAAVGLLTVSVFSFPVAALVSSCVYVLAFSRAFLDEAFEYYGETGLPPALDMGMKLFMKGVHLTLKSLYWLIPNFSQYDAVELLANGRNVTLMWVLQGMLWLGILRTLVVLVSACILFQRREVAELSV